MEKIRKYLKWLENIIPQAKSVAIMREIIFGKGEAFMRAIIYLIQAIFIGIVLISVVDYLTNLFGIENEFAKNIIFVALYSMYIASNIFDVILQLDKMRDKHNQTVEELQAEIDNIKEKYEKEINLMEESFIACKYARMDCENRLKKFQIYYEDIRQLFRKIERSRSKAISKNWIMSEYMKVENSFDRVSSEMIPFEDFRAIEKRRH